MVFHYRIQKDDAFHADDLVIYGGQIQLDLIDFTIQITQGFFAGALVESSQVKGVQTVQNILFEW